MYNMPQKSNKNSTKFDEELFLEIAKEMGIEVAEGPGLDMVDGKEVDVMDLLFNEDHGFFRTARTAPSPQKPPQDSPEDS